MKRIALIVMALSAMTAFAADDTDPVKGRLVDPNKYANYSEAMASHKKYPMAYEWQSRNETAIAEAVKLEVLRAYLADSQAAAKLLGKVDCAYNTDAIAALQIAAVTQLVMKPGASATDRALWVNALVGAALQAKDSYRKIFFLDQLRWCGSKDDAAKIAPLAKDADKAVADMVRIVTAEISR